MTTYVLRRLAFGAILIFLATILSFAILKLSPGEAGAAEIDPRLSQEYIDQQKRVFGLDQPAWRQYLSWLGVLKLFVHDAHSGLLQGDLGVSISYKQPVKSVIAPRLVACLRSCCWHGWIRG